MPAYLIPPYGTMGCSRPHSWSAIRAWTADSRRPLCWSSQSWDPGCCPHQAAMRSLQRPEDRRRQWIVSWFWQPASFESNFFFCKSLSGQTLRTSFSSFAQTKMMLNSDGQDDGGELFIPWKKTLLSLSLFLSNGIALPGLCKSFHSVLIWIKKWNGVIELVWSGQIAFGKQPPIRTVFKANSA